jgi:hypothetical protein
MARAAVCLCLIATLSGTSSWASAQEEGAETAVAAPSGAEAALDAIREQVLYARYADADAAVTALLARTDLTAEERNGGLEMRAVILIARRRLPDARTVLAELYARDPEHRLGYRDAGPNVRDEFDRARETHAATLAVELTDQTQPLTERAAPEIVIALGAGADAIDELRLSYGSGTASFERTLMRIEGGEGHARLPLLEGRDAYSLHYYVEVLAPSGYVLQSLGTSAAPMTLEVPEAPEVVAPSFDPAILATTGPAAPVSHDVTEEAWFWTVIAVVVLGGAGAAVGIGYATTATGPQPGTLGEGRL